MAIADGFQLIDAVEELLDKERKAILSGALEDIGRIAQEKDRMLTDSALMAPDRNTLERIRHKANRNQILIAAAMRGVRAVTARLDILRNGQPDLNTYDSAGQRKKLSSTNRRALERRA